MIKKISFLLIVPFALFGENLPQLIELSKNNKMIDSSRLTVESTKDSYESVKNSYMPKFSVGAGYSNNSYESTGYPENSINVNGSVGYTLYDGGKKGNTYDSYEASIKSGSESLENFKNQIAIQVTNYYYNYLSYVAQKEVKLQEIEQLEAQYIRLKKFLDAGTVTDDEVQKIISNIQIAKVALHELDLNIETINHNLEYVIGQSVNIQSGSTISEYDSKENKLRADLKATEYQLEALKSSARATKSGKLPKVTLNDTYTHNELEYSNSSYATDDYNRNLASINLSWDIFDFDTTNKAYEAAYKKYLSLKSQFEYEKNKANVDLKLANKAYEIGKLKIESAQAGLNAANSAYKTIKSKYEAGLVDNVTYLAALTDRYSAESSLKVAYNDLELKKANIIYYSGEKLEEFVK
jgi:outer membrane protein